MPGDDDTFSSLNLVEEFTQMRFGLYHGYRRHVWTWKESKNWSLL
jgi:hypothetical protein